MTLQMAFPLLLAGSLLAAVTQAAPAAHAAIQARDLSTHTNWHTEWVTTTVYVDQLPSPTPLSTSNVAEEETAPAPETPADPAPETPAAPAPETPAAPAPETPNDPAPETPNDPAPEKPKEADSAPGTFAQGAKGGSSSGGSTSADCSSSSSSCKGDITHWEGGLGACGTVVNTDGENAIALPYEFMGPESNSNSYCGKTVTVINPVTGTTVQGKIKDKCMGCYNRHIDLTNKMFKEVTDGAGDGLEHNFEWYLS